MGIQGMLFSEPSISETGVWCCLSEGVDPAEWSEICRYIGTLKPEDFEKVKRKILPNFRYKQRKNIYPGYSSVGEPLISIGPSGIGGQYQKESF